MLEVEGGFAGGMAWPSCVTSAVLAALGRRIQVRFNVDSCESVSPHCPRNMRVTPVPMHIFGTHRYMSNTLVPTVLL